MIDHLDGDAEPPIEARRAAQLLVYRVAVDQEKEMVALVPLEKNAARADVRREQGIEGDRAEAEKIDGFGQRVDPVDAHVLRGERRRRGGRGRRRLDRFGSRGEDVLVEEPFQVRCVFGANRERCRSEQHSGDSGKGMSPLRRGHSNTRTSLSTSERNSTCCRRARVRCTSSFGLPDTTSKPRTTPCAT